MLARVFLTLLLVAVAASVLLTARRSARIGEAFERQWRGHSDWPHVWAAQVFAAACLLVALLVAVGVLHE